MFSLLQRQLFREILYIFLLSTAVLLTLVLISRAVQMRELFLGLDMGIVDTVRLFAFMTPLFLMMVIPVACMLSVFLTFLRMGTDRELIALKAGGVSMYQMLPAPAVFSILCLGLTLWVSLHWLAWGMGHFRESLMSIASTQARIVVQPGVFNSDFPGLVLFARQVDPESGLLKQVLVDDRSRPERNLVILAPSGSIDTDSERGELLFSLQDGSIHTVSKGTTSKLAFETYLVRLPLDSLFKSLDLGEIRPREMKWSHLVAAQGKPRFAEDPVFANRVAVELQKRWAYPAACLALTLFVLPLATAFQGMHRQTGLVLALVMFFVYYGLMSLGMSMGEAGTVPPVVGLWVSNGLFFTLGLVGLYLANKERVPDLGGIFARLAARLGFKRKPRSTGDHT